MLKATEQNNKLKRAIILSIALHCVLITALILSSIHQPQEPSAGGGLFIDAVMVDPGAMVQQYNRQQQETDVQRAEQQRNKQTLQQVEELQQKQAAKQAQAQKKQAKAAAAQAKAAAAAKQQAEATQAAAQAAKQSSDVDALLGGLLTDAKNAPKAGAAQVGVGKAKQSGAIEAGIDAYKEQVSRAISNKFYDASSYSGRTCDLRIKLAPNGLLISVTAVGGDPLLCQAAVSAAKLATIPRPPSLQVYEVFKNATLGFSPQ